MVRIEFFTEILMRKCFTRLGLSLCLLSVSCANKKIITEKMSLQTEKDSFLWLEEIEGTKALEFVKNENDKTLAVLKNDSHFKNVESEIRKISLAQDRVPWAYQQGDYLYNFWQDETNIKGLWRRTSYKSYENKNPKWETVLDLDLLSKKENDNWVWKGANCFPPKYERCLLSLSRGGKDASVVREFDLKNKNFVKNGFEIPEAKNRLWSRFNDRFRVPTYS